MKRGCEPVRNALRNMMGRKATGLDILFIGQWEMRLGGEVG